MLTGSGSINFQAAFGLGSTGQFSAIHSNAVATDSSGDTFITGSFRATVGFDPQSTASTITTNNTQDTFVAKYSSLGTLDWVVTFVGHSTTLGGNTTYAVSQGSAIAVDASGNVYVAGSFEGTVDFGSGSSLTELASPNGTEVFAAKLNASGALTWVQTSGGSVQDNDAADALALDGSGGVTIAGSYADTATFGSTTLQAGGASEAFVARVNSLGQFAWAVSTQGSSGSNAQANGLAVDGSGNIALAGYFSGTVNFSPGTSSNVLTASGSDDASVWKLNSSGQVLWARSYGSPDYDAASGVAFDSLGNVYATGTFSDTVEFGVGSSGDTLTAGSIFDVFTIKLDRSGNEVWAKGFVGPSGYAKGQGIAVDAAGNVHVAGVFTSTVSFNPASGGSSLTSAASASVFVAGLDTFGNFVYALGAGVSNFNAGLGIAVNPTGLIATTGSYSGSISFGSVTVPAIGNTAIFVAGLLVPIQPIAPSSPILEAGSDTGTNNNTSINKPTFDVNTAITGETVELLRDGVVVNHRVGPGAIQDPGPAPDGTHLYTTLELTPTGIASPSSPGTSVTFLTHPPAAPSSPTLYAADDSGVLGDGITNVRSPRVFGTAQANTTLQILNAANVVLGTTSVSSIGSYVVALAGPLSQGTYLLHAVSTDLAGNVGPSSPTSSLTIQYATPTTPSAPSLLASDDSGIVGDGITNVRKPRILVSEVGTGLTVEILNAANMVVGSSTSSGNGVYTITPTSSLADGTYPLRAVAVDVAGNQSAAGPTFSLVILANPLPGPLAPSLLAADDSGILGDGMTSVVRPRLVGSAVPGARIDWLNSSGSVVASTTASPTNGSYQLQAPTSFANGTYAVQVRETDVAGNVSPVGLTFNLTIRATVADYLGNSISDVGTFSPNTNNFNIQQPTTGALYRQTLGISGDVPVQGDFFGDGHDDLAVFRPSTATFYVSEANSTNVLVDQWGVSGDVPIPGNYDGLGKADVAVFRPSNETFYVLMNGVYYAKQWGVSGDIPVPGDYFGTGHLDLAVFRPSTATFYVFDPSTGATQTVQWGASGDIAMPADYEGVGHSDFAVFRPSTATFYVRMSSGTLDAKQFGAVGDIPISGDYFGQGRASVAVYRPSTSTTYAADLTTIAYRAQQWGSSNLDEPLTGPITTYFSFGGMSPKLDLRGGNNGPVPGASSAFGAIDLTWPPSATTNLIPTLELGDASTPRPRRHSAVDRVIESWEAMNPP